ncbi:hypothetical protein SAMN05216464_113141 [Mucilaginibacter pineti]|uniref:Uncharacterized protein n=1 Tax=Mucilaginibacter pineti TaxID=1391627 RepID=A0A1G7ISG0_9SPHI|nr:hypothetical protein [Mucilaginibacter pineti]SDF15484.1 hypothetical protein SAMN05216464_113141 [Mucilaginibacter pineti]
MSTNAINDQQYPFAWLDEIIETTLNPAKTNIRLISADQLRQIAERLPGEISGILSSIKTQAFCLYITDQIKVVAGHYDQAIRLLRAQAQENQQQYPKTGMVSKTGQLIISSLEQLSNHLHHRYGEYLPESPRTRKCELRSEESTLKKIVCGLSADQLGILLRAAFDVKVIIANSFRKVCQILAPYLSTVWKAGISWDAMRSNAGRPESRDKEVAIETLEKMIETIKGYR